MATSTDFEKSGYGGFKLDEAQKIRCKEKLYREIVSVYSSPALAENIEHYTCQRIVDDLLKKDFKIHYEYIGHDK